MSLRCLKFRNTEPEYEYKEMKAHKWTNTNPS